MFLTFFLQLGNMQSHRTESIPDIEKICQNGINELIILFFSNVNAEFELSALTSMTKIQHSSIPVNKMIHMLVVHILLLILLSYLRPRHRLPC